MACEDPDGEVFEWPQSKLDLNLLAIFDTVMEERHVTRASKRLGLTQSAVSNALNRLRKAYDDMLFVKTPKGVEPTKYALALWQEIHSAIAQLQRTIKPEEFNPATTTLEYRVSIVDLAAALLTPYLMDTMQSVAPRVGLAFTPHVPDLTSERLARGEVDFAICVETPRMAVLESMPLWSEEYVIAGRRGHPRLMQPIRLDDFCDFPQLSVNLSGSPDFVTPVDQALADIGRSRRVALTVNQFLVATAILRDSDLLAVLPKRLVMESHCSDWLTYQNLPMKVNDVTLHLVWHRRSNTLQSMAWFKDRVMQATAEMNADLRRARVRVAA